ncbi:hypothetical protein ACWGLF_05280 [Streptomyces puniciscabiei]
MLGAGVLLAPAYPDSAPCAVPLPAACATRLYRLATPHGPMSMYGFRAGRDGGRRHGATLVAALGGDSQVQLRPLTEGPASR